MEEVGDTNFCGGRCIRFGQLERYFTVRGVLEGEKIQVVMVALHGDTLGVIKGREEEYLMDVFLNGLKEKEGFKEERKLVLLTTLQMIELIGNKIPTMLRNMKTNFKRLIEAKIQENESVSSVRISLGQPIYEILIEEKQSKVQLSMHSIMGLTTIRYLKVWGQIGEWKAGVLVDCGATHNFISTDMVKKVKLTITHISLYFVEVGGPSM
ncbi:hypothetical protein CR513_01482, partial [Mucuna pruriens]